MLVEMVEKDLLTIKDAASRLKINYSTAKHIIKTHKKDVAKGVVVAPNSPPKIDVKDASTQESSSSAAQPIKEQSFFPSAGKRFNPVSVDRLESELRNEDSLYEASSNLRVKAPCLSQSSLSSQSPNLMKGQSLCPGSKSGQSFFSNQWPQSAQSLPAQPTPVAKPPSFLQALAKARHSQQSGGQSLSKPSSF